MKSHYTSLWLFPLIGPLIGYCIFMPPSLGGDRLLDIFQFPILFTTYICGTIPAFLTGGLCVLLQLQRGWLATVILSIYGATVSWAYGIPMSKLFHISHYEWFYHLNFSQSMAITGALTACIVSIFLPTRNTMTTPN